MTATLSELDRARLRWRARRGLLENDLMLTRFLDAHEASLTDADVGLLHELLALTDNELLDLLLQRSAPAQELDRPEVHALLQRIQSC